jgi:ABC-type iron transport system FetAB permease component
VTLVVTWLSLVLRVATLLLFPALAVWARRTGGAARLWRVTALGVAGVLLFAAFVASSAGGNRLVSSHGYGYTARGSLLLHGLTLGLPMVAVSLMVQVLTTRLSSRLALYATGVLVAGAAWTAGIVAVMWIYYAVLR